MPFLREWRELFRFRSISSDARSIVFYAENAGSWRYFEPIISELVESHGKQICYVTSSIDDPVLRNQDSSVQSFCIGLGSARTLWFKTLQAGVAVMTMPDLENYYIKRSKHPVHYIYAYHSIVSTHMVYRRGAFDHFDSILCVGPHHRDEIRAAEQLYGLKPKMLIEAGYGLLDSILRSKEMTTAETPPVGGGGKRVLIAPSWGEDGLLETYGLELVEVLLRAGHRVTVRPHVMTMRHRPELMTRMSERFATSQDFRLELDLTCQGTVQATDVMISDWSGAALEYAFGLERPVIFVDVPRKVNNPDYEKIPCVPVEVKLRSEIGELVSPGRLSDVPALVNKLCQNPELWKDRIRELRTRWIYNVGTSGKVAAAHIVEAVDIAKGSGREAEAATSHRSGPSGINSEGMV